MIVYAILQHATLTGTLDYIAHYGLEVMIAVSRFWSQRVSFSQPKQKYVILGVTGPDEYENNVNNNWYTNYSCMRCLETTLSFLEIIARQYPDEYARICSITNLNYTEESERWRDIIERMYLPEDPERGIFIQNDGYMDKVLQSTDAIPPANAPSTSIGRGTVSCVRATSSRVMSCSACTSIISTSTGRPSAATSNSTNR